MEADDTSENPSDPRVKKALSLMRRARRLMVPEAMRSIGLTSNNVDNRWKRMWIHRRVKKKNDDTPASASLRLDGDVLSVSLSGNSLPLSSVKYPVPTLEQIRKTMTGKQQQCSHAKATEEHKNRAQKYATESEGRRIEINRSVVPCGFRLWLTQSNRDHRSPTLVPSSYEWTWRKDW